jgi:hypothetical protein
VLVIPLVVVHLGAYDEEPPHQSHLHGGEANKTALGSCHLNGRDLGLQSLGKGSALHRSPLTEGVELRVAEIYDFKHLRRIVFSQFLCEFFHYNYFKSNAIEAN